MKKYTYYVRLIDTLGDDSDTVLSVTTSRPMGLIVHAINKAIDYWRKGKIDYSLVEYIMNVLYRMHVHYEEVTANPINIYI